MPYFDFDGRLREEDRVGSAISRREAVLMSLLAHAIFTIIVLLAPDAPWWSGAAEVAAVQPATADERSLPFVLVETARRPDVTADRPRVASDIDRIAAAPERAVQPTNDQPMSRGNSADMIDGTPGPMTREPVTPGPETARAAPAASPAAPSTAPSVRTAPPRATGTPGLGESLRNMDQLIRRERFDNPTGGQNLDDPAISFDSKGVDFGPWLNRFVAQVKRNWLIPYAAMTMKGRVVLTFHVHRDGRITDLQVVQASDIGAFNTAAFQALVGSNPTLALPPEYPDDKALFTVTFFYNERPR